MRPRLGASRLRLRRRPGRRTRRQSRAGSRPGRSVPIVGSPLGSASVLHDQADTFVRPSWVPDLPRLSAERAVVPPAGALGCRPTLLPTAHRRQPDTFRLVKVVPPVGGSTLTSLNVSGRARSCATGCQATSRRRQPRRRHLLDLLADLQGKQGGQILSPSRAGKHAA
jgi:hypothetical protein